MWLIDLSWKREKTGLHRQHIAVKSSLFCGAILLLTILCRAEQIFAYSVLTHEEVVDLLWKDEIVPNLRARFPGLTEAQLREAHAYSYGGSVIQDLGYYPFGNKEFSNLTHYVRSGDFVQEMIRQSRDANEFAFAMGALAHYVSDESGHPAVNQSVALLYPKLRAKYGASVTFAENKTAHIKTEFGFDVAQVAKNRYVSDQYHNFVGFQVSKSLLERVFPIVYGRKLSDVIPNLDLTIGSYRYAVSQFIPMLTTSAAKAQKNNIPPSSATPAQQLFQYRLSRAEYEKEWGTTYSKPGFFLRILGALTRVIPKVGPLRKVMFRPPTPETQELYVQSINATVDLYKKYLRQVRSGSLALRNLDLDSGKPSTPLEYTLSDETHEDLLIQLSGDKFASVTPELRRTMMNYFANFNPPLKSRKDRSHWRKVQESLMKLKSAPQ